MKVLLVQCCHLPQWFFIWKKLEDRHPDWEIQALATPHDDARYYVRRLVPDRVVHFLGDGNVPDGFDLVIFPLTNRGYLRIRWAAWRLSGRKVAVDFEGNTVELGAVRFWAAALRPASRPSSEFVDQYESFPHRPLGEKVLVVESCHPALVSRTEPLLAVHFRRQREISRVGREGFLHAWKQVRGRAFDGAVVYCSGEPGYLLVRLIPFLLRIPRILVVNESGDFFYAGARSLTSFLFRRLRGGCGQQLWAPRVLLVQTEDRRYTAAAAQRLREDGLFPEARILLVARAEDREQLEPLGDQVEPFWLRRHPSWRDLWALRRTVRQFRPDFNAAVFTGSPGFRWQKLLFFLLGSRRSFIFNARLDGYWLSLGTFPRLWRHEPLMFGLEAQRTILLIQTESAAYTRAAIERIRSGRLFPEARIVLWCRPQDAQVFAGLPAVEVTPWSRDLTLLWKRWRQAAGSRLEAAVGIFTGRPVFRPAKLLFWLAPCRRRFAFNAQLEGYWVNWRTWPWMLRREPVLLGAAAPEARRVVLVQTEGVEYTRAAAARIRDPRLFPGAKILLWCRPEDRSAFSGVPDLETEPYPRSLTDLWRSRRRLARRHPEAVFGIFTGRPVFRLAKLLFWLAPAPRRFAFNAQLEGYWVNWRTAGRMRRMEPLLFKPPGGRGLRVVLVQTEVAEYVRAAAARIQEPHLFPGARVLLVCREADARHLADLPGLERTLTFRSGASWSEFFRLRREVRRFRPQVRAAVMTGRSVFRGSRLLFLCSGLRRGLVFNAALDGYWLSPRTLPRMWRREPLLFGEHHAGPRGVLLFETEGLDLMAKALSVLKLPHVAGGSPIQVFCHQDRAGFYRSQPGVERTICYGKQSLAADLRAVMQVLRERPGAVAAVLSGRPVFTFHKLLFWLTPTRHKLIFNSALDCFYLSRENFGLLFRKGRHPQYASPLEALLRPAVKALLFLPRFGYLILWARWARR